ncbi:MAG: gamma-glutamylcyclotransferase, partial [Deltaproteobacteria bacterium]|nr:gamma-glutamylcyclotransferase [Deltaproteobacteria bacterium]
ETLRMLDHRERGGYCRLVTRLHFAANGEETEPGLLYLARPRNRNYLGPAPMHEIARQIASARGPSGANSEYLERLAETLRGLGARDDHVFELESLVLGERDGAAGSRRQPPAQLSSARR